MATAAQTEPVAHVRAIWAAHARGGVDAMRRVAGDDVEWIPLSETAPVPKDEFWGEWGRRRTEQVSVTVHGYEQHGACVLVHGSMRTFREGGFIDEQPSWAYFFAGGRLVRSAGYATREEALAAISRFAAEG